MSAETSKPDNQVHDGVQNDTDPVPKEPDGPAAAGNGPSLGPLRVPEAGSEVASHSASADPIGLAEERDRASVDDRGLTTEVAPSD